MDPVVSFPKADGHDGPGLIDEPVPGVAAVIDDIAARSEDAVRQPIVAEVLPDILSRIMPQSGCRGSFSTASTRYYSACCLNRSLHLSCQIGRDVIRSWHVH